MKLVSLVVLAAAACGGSSRPPVAANSGGTVTTRGVPAAWAEVLVEGARFQLDNRSPDESQAGESFVVVAHVDKVTTVGDATRAELRWTDAADGPVMSGGLPLLIQVSPAGVWFASSNDGADDAFFAAAPTFPAGTDKTLRDGSYDVVTTNPDGTLCYGWEPGPDAGDCEDVCFADLCVAPGQGIVSGSGNWWPNAEMYRAVAK